MSQLFSDKTVLRGALLIAASELMFASMGAMVKALSTDLPSEVVVFMRNLFGLFLLLPLLWWSRGSLGGLRSGVLRFHLLRSLLGLSAMYCFFYALAHLPLAEGVLLKMTAPIFMPLIGLLWLRESVGRYAAWAVPIGFVGVYLVLSPDGELRPVALIGLLGGLLAALAKVTVRRLGRSEPPDRTVFYFALIATGVSAVPMLWAWQTPQPLQWGMLAAMGLFGTLGQMLLSRGYAAAPVSKVGPFTYFSVVFAGLYGYLFWGETIDLIFIAGTILITLSGVFAVRRDAISVRENNKATML